MYAHQISGHVTREEMMEFGRFMNSKFDEDKLNKLMDQMDLDKDGFISREEFLGYFAKVRTSVLPLLACSWVVEACLLARASY